MDVEWRPDDSLCKGEVMAPDASGLWYMTGTHCCDHFTPVGVADRRRERGRVRRGETQEAKAQEADPRKDKSCSSEALRRPERGTKKTLDPNWKNLSRPVLKLKTKAAG